MQKVFKMASSKQQEEKILNHLVFVQKKFLFIDLCQPDTKITTAKQTNVTSYVSWIRDGGYN